MSKDCKNTLISSMQMSLCKYVQARLMGGGGLLWYPTVLDSASAGRLGKVFRIS